MDSSGLVMDRQALYHRRPGRNTNPTQRSDSMTLQQQQLLKLLNNAHAGGGGGAGGLVFLGAGGNGAATPVQVQQYVPPHSYAAAPLMGVQPFRSHPPPPVPPRPVFSSMPAPRVMHQRSNPPLLPLPFSRSASLPTPAPGRPHVNGVQRSKPGGQPAAPRPNSAKELQKSRASKASAMGGAASAAPVKRKEEASAAVGKKVEAAKQQPNVSIGTEQNKVVEAAAAAVAKGKKGGVHPAAEVLTATDSRGFVVYPLAPHPSSLPLPRLISLRPKDVLVPASCNAEALGVGTDAAEVPGAARDDLRRLLRL